MFDSTVVPTEYEANYVKKLTFDQIIAHLKLLGDLLFFTAKKATGRSDREDWEALADTIDYATLESISEVPLSMSFVAKNSPFSRQKYQTICENLEILGVFAYQRVTGRLGPTYQGIRNLLDINWRKVIEMIRDLCDRIPEIITAPTEHSLWPSHGFAFLLRWHRRVFGYDPTDRAFSDELKATALDDRDVQWERSVHQEEVTAYIEVVEKKEISESKEGWGPQVVANVRSRLAYPEDWWDGGRLWAKHCPSLSRLTYQEFEFVQSAKLYLQLDHLPSWGGDASEAAQFQATLEVAIEWGEDKANGTGKGRPIAAAHPWAWREIVVKKREWRSKPYEPQKVERSVLPEGGNWQNIWDKFFGGGNA